MESIYVLHLLLYKSGRTEKRQKLQCLGRGCFGCCWMCGFHGVALGGVRWCVSVVLVGLGLAESQSQALRRSPWVCEAKVNRKYNGWMLEFLSSELYVCILFLSLADIDSGNAQLFLLLLNTCRWLLTLSLEAPVRFHCRI